ncbi:MAG: hypothetical protein K8T20_17625 [Planctomycetes bacterium]|nr:hypothetical protein [Planctomycetota bacterium]
MKHDGLRVQLIFSALWLPAEGGGQPEEIRVSWEVEQAGPGKFELIQSSAKTPPQAGWQARVASWLAAEIWPAVRKRAEMPE